MTQYINRKAPPGDAPANFTGPIACGRFECNQQEGTIRLHNIGYAYLREDLIGRPVNFDLMAGIETFVRRENRKPSLGERIMWLEANHKRGVSLKEAVRNADFFTGNGALKAIGTFPFTQYSVKIIGFKLKGVIFLTLVGADDEKKETEADYVRDYMGSKFEQYMTSKEPGGKPLSNSPLNTFDRRMIMCQSAFGRLKCMYSAEVDSVTAGGRFVELKTEVEDLYPSWHLACKYGGWYLQCRMAGVKEIVVGIKPKTDRRNGPSTTVSSTKSFAVEDLPTMVDGQTAWSPSESFSYIAFYLAKVKAILDDKPEGTIISTQLLGRSAQYVEIKLEPPDTSPYGYLWEELSDRLRMFK
ncbi:dom-3 [Aphelenchoides avenae]|nr:dom-3 [Aphelenchus avenae]